MSIKNAADLVRSQGRYGDSQLMHVSPKEVEALQTIAQTGGKSLSINPQTGLPEAFDLGAMLPAIAGTAVGSMFGMPFLGAAVGGLGTYATTGSLEKGLMAGLGAFGGASALGSLGGVGAASGSTLSASGAVPAAAAQTAIGPSAAATIESGMSGALGGAFEGVNLAGGTPASLANYGQTAFNALAPAQKMSAIGSGFGELMSDPSQTFAQMGGLKGQGRNLAMMAAPFATGAFSGQPSTPETDTGYIRQYDFDPKNRFTAHAPVKASGFTGFAPRIQGSRFAVGGDVQLTPSNMNTGFMPTRYKEGGIMQLANGGSVETLYTDILGRAPDADGLQYWQNVLNSGASLEDVRAAFEASPEAQVRQMYLSNLGREPESEGLQYWRDQLSAGAGSQDVAQAIASSPEAQVRQMYVSELGREPDSEGLQYWRDQLSAGAGAQDVAQAIATSPEAQVRQMYVDDLGREPDPEGREYWKSKFDEGATAEDIARGIGTSDEAKERIIDLYEETLGRGTEGDEEGLQYWLDKLGGPATLKDIREGLSGSNEAAVRGLYKDELGREPDPEGREFWKSKLADGAGLEAIREAIRSSEEAKRRMQLINQQAQTQPSPIVPTQVAPPTTPGPAAPSGFPSQSIGQPIPQLPTTYQGMFQDTIPDRYKSPTFNIPPPVGQYNRELQARADYEYNAFGRPDSMRPRGPEEMAALREYQNTLGTDRIAAIKAGKEEAKETLHKIDPTTTGDYVTREELAQMGFAAGSGTFSGGNQADGMGSGVGSDGNDTNQDGSMGDMGGLMAMGGAVRRYAQGGIPESQNTPTFQAGGEMESDAFIVPADVVSALGNGSSEAGVDLLNQYLGMAMPIKGEGDGLSDDIPATIDGEQPARVADGEVYIPADVVAMIGGGNPERGAAKLYAMLDKIRESAHGKTKQQGEVDPDQVMPV